MANYVLVHGGSVTGAVWDPVALILKSSGHKVYAITLSDEKHTSLTKHISEVCALIEAEKLNGVFLVGHSYGGLVITGVNDRITEKLQRLIFLDTCLPISGESLFGLFRKYGFNPEDFEGLYPYAQFTEPLFFDEVKFRTKLKTYVHCMESEFLAVTVNVRDAILKRLKEDNWDYFELNSKHNCMFYKPQETAEILLKYAK